MIKIQKLDKRHRGYGQWKYHVEYHELDSYTLSEDRQTFFDIRKWCWKIWGASKELDEWLDEDTPLAHCRNEYWCWRLDDLNRRIYLRTDAELAMMKLRWS